MAWSWLSSVVLLRLYNNLKSIQIWSFFWSVFSRIRSEYGKILGVSPYSVRKRENTDQKKLRTWTIFTQYPPFPRTFFEWIYMNNFKMVVSENFFVGKIFKTRKNYLPMSLFPMKMQVCMSLKRELQCSVLLLKHYLSVPLVPLLLFFKQSCFTFQYIQFFATPWFYFLAAFISVNLEKNYFVCIQVKLLFKLLFLS